MRLCLIILSGILYATNCFAQYQFEKAMETKIIPFDKAIMNLGSDDFTNLSVFLNNKKIIAMGEATHGTSEFFKIKHHMYKNLVKEKGFRVFLMEATFGECMLTNDYIQFGKESALSALKAMEGNGWQNVEILDMLKWMRKFNTDKKKKDQIRFYGFDLIYTRGSANKLINYLEKVDSVYAGSLYMELVDFRNNKLHHFDDVPNEAELLKWTLALRPVIKSFVTNESVYISKSSRSEYNLARQHLKILEQALDILKEGDRDQFQAENVQWIMNYEQKNAKAMLWAHNGHISYEGPGHLGYYLKNIYGNQFYSIGFEFDSGSVLVHESDKYLIKKLKPALPGSYCEKFGRLKVPFFLDFSSCISDSLLWDDLCRPQMHRHIGVDFNHEEETYKIISMPQCYHSVIFIKHTNPAAWINRIY